MKPTKAWAIKDRKGNVRAIGLGTRRSVWLNLVFGFRDVEASVKSCKSRGYRCVRVEIKEIS